MCRDHRVLRGVRCIRARSKGEDVDEQAVAPGAVCSGREVGSHDAASSPAPATRQSFEEFVAARSGALLRTAYLLTQDRHLAEDLLQTSLAKAWRSWGRVDTSHEAYVRRIVVNTYSTWWRRRWNCESPVGELPEVEHHDRDGSSADDMRSALARLPKRQRAVIVLRYYEDLTEAETARVMACSIGTVKSQTSKALAKLRIDPAMAQTTGEPA
jgi:RNA polymerase sigma-70 factor (sigma-E family)